MQSRPPPASASLSEPSGAIDGDGEGGQFSRCAGDAAAVVSTSPPPAALAAARSAKTTDAIAALRWSLPARFIPNASDKPPFKANIVGLVVVSSAVSDVVVDPDNIGGSAVASVSATSDVW